MNRKRRIDQMRCRNRGDCEFRRFCVLLKQRKTEEIHLQKFDSEEEKLIDKSAQIHARHLACSFIYARNASFKPERLRREIGISIFSPRMIIAFALMLWMCRSETA